MTAVEVVGESRRVTIGTRHSCTCREVMPCAHATWTLTRCLHIDHKTAQLSGLPELQLARVLAAETAQPISTRRAPRQQPNRSATATSASAATGSGLGRDSVDWLLSLRAGKPFCMCTKAVQSAVIDLCGFEDAVVAGMIMRHLERASLFDGVDPQPTLISLLSILIGERAAVKLTHMCTAQGPVSSQLGAAAHRVGASTTGSRDKTARGMVTPRCVWPFTGQPPRDRNSALDTRAPWDLTACGVEVRPCCEHPAKGMGVFARRELLKGQLVGVYWGEKLTHREYLSRYDGPRDRDGAIVDRSVDGRSSARGSLSAILDRATAVKRRTRLEALTQGKPTGDGAYVFVLPPNAHSLVHGEPVYCIDAEDPNRSSWCRYFNHAKDSTVACNVDAQISAHGDIWFVTNQGIAAGTELCFDYGPWYITDGFVVER